MSLYRALRLSWALRIAWRNLECWDLKGIVELECRCLLWFYLYCDISLEFNLVPFVSNYTGVRSLACVKSGQEFFIALIKYHSF
jgi:hypothetical protein